MLQWLVDTHGCPLRSIRISGKSQKSSGSFTPILTSRGRSLLGIAMEKEKIDLVRYLVVDKGMPLAGEKDLNMGTLIRILDRILRTIPPPGNAQPPGSSPTRQSEASSRADEALAFELAEQYHCEEDSEGSVDDAVSLEMDYTCCHFCLPSNHIISLSTAVYHLLCQLHRLCRYSLRTSNLLHGVQQKHLAMSRLRCGRLLFYQGL